MPDQYSPPPPGLPVGARVWRYLRDSGGPSQEQSVDQQEKEITTYCKRNGLELVKIFRDIACSGGSVVGRDEFISMIDLARKPGSGRMACSFGTLPASRVTTTILFTTKRPFTGEGSLFTLSLTRFLQMTLRAAWSKRSSA